MSKPAPHRLSATIAGISLTLLALYSPLHTARAQMPTVVYPSGAGHSSEAASQHSRNGIYVFETAVNGTPLPMLFDTGASVVSLRAEDAEKVGINTRDLTYSVTIRTANGTGLAAPVVIDTLSVGPITRHNVAALVGRPGTLHVNLMGQTFLTRIAGFHRDGDQIVLQGE
jgi:aspartyl protease family protein